MAKIFISYKYADKHVKQNQTCDWNAWHLEVDNGNYLTCRDYVTHLMEKVLVDHINKAEKDDEDLSHLTEEVIQQKLFDRIYDSTITIILMSKNMKESTKEKHQWIPREVAYSLREQSRDDRTSHTNGMLAVFLPDENNSYEYAVTNKSCGVRSWNTPEFFRIVNKNMFNRLDKKGSFCNICLSHHHSGNDHSYIHPVKWTDFIQNHNEYIEHVLDLKERLEEFDISKSLD